MFSKLLPKLTDLIRRPPGYLMHQTTGPIRLCPTQTEALDFLTAWREQTPILHVWAESGFGKSEVLKELQRQTGAHWLDVRPFVADVAARHPLAMQDSLWQLLMMAIEKHSSVIVDDFNLFFDYATGCSGSPRGSYHETVAKALLLTLASKRGQLILGSNGQLPEAFAYAQWSTSIEDFTVDDYRHLFEQFLGPLAANLDFDSIFRFAPNLNIYRMQRICHWLKTKGTLTTEEILDFVQTQGMASNVEVSEVQEVELKDLRGVDEVITALEDYIIMPMENLKLAAELGLAPKRGVMLAGPPGTGKTTIGRALARRLRGKFFLIDGTVISGTEYFYHHVNSIFHMAMANAPAIVFIDDSDVIFESGREHGLYRYLLTMLDGLESKSANNVCVIMTAMDLGNIPPALVRSGRIELWLEMKLPDAVNRPRLLQQLMADKVQLRSEHAWPAIAEVTDGFSGADLKRMVADAKLNMAVDMTRGREVQAFENYLLRSAESIKLSRTAYAQSARRAMDVNVNRPRWFNIHPELFDNHEHAEKHSQS